jgi:hypothetical protein
LRKVVRTTNQKEAPGNDDWALSAKYAILRNHVRELWDACHALDTLTVSRLMHKFGHWLHADPRQAFYVEYGSRAIDVKRQLECSFHGKLLANIMRKVRFLIPQSRNSAKEKDKDHKGN